MNLLEWVRNARGAGLRSGPKGAYTAPVRMSETNDSGAAEIPNMSHGAPTTLLMAD